MQILSRSALAVLLTVCVVPAQAGESAGVEALGWMAGSWGSQQGDMWVEEHWLAPRGGLMLGTNRSGDKDKAKAFEFLRIVAGPDGVPIYWATPEGGTTTAFRQIASGPRSVTFENRANSYPTRIRYRLSGETLEATIEGPNGDSPMSWTWHRRTRPH